MIHGERSVVRIADKQNDCRSQWVARLEKRQGWNVAVVLLAKNTHTAGFPEL
uniref:Transposase n=1 Tax=Candidatus Kentrum eta TaxID=2126337 RepID=A0A450VE45_9GAMM|nr:MAG: hypothetical protein BECKH772B_GA0070898_103213 [Candidatus Kentron sp. H]VFK04056.1 MAG: hypothetical protein BECKH772A_GA0070896_103773 [Candidatus Kentron sp. H]VFK06760.1 MAG: hypothetical protein BECKH772C_GA0070978_103723 [Candidatus Kentron sp. H]